MITKNQGKAYAAITLDLLYKMKVKVNPEVFAEQMNLTYDLYEADEVEDLYKIMINNNKVLLKNISGKANCYIINFHNSSQEQVRLLKKFCGNNIELGKIYITPPGENTNRYYELIQDIRNKNMDILIMSIFTIYSMSNKEYEIILHLCRENEIFFVEI